MTHAPSVIGRAGHTETAMTAPLKIRRALISVSDKTGLIDQATRLRSVL